MFRGLIVFALMLPALRAIAVPNTDADVVQFRKDMEAEARNPHGYLALVGLQWLADGDTAVGAADGNKLKLTHLPANAAIFHQQGGHVSLVAPAGGFDACMKVNGKPAMAQALAADRSGKPDEVTCNGFGMTVIERGDRLYLRVRDEHSPTLLAFHGLHWYPNKPAFRLPAKWVPYAEEREVRITNVLGQTSLMKTPGYAEFLVDGKSVRLEPVSAGRDRLWYIFRDTTSQTETYRAGRFMYSALPDGGIGKPGTVMLDFNEAYNPPCAYTPYATCPLPPAANRLKIAIPAGEKRYHE